ncbi:MAG: ATP-binding protein [Prevotellaceae bacterium]|jgi:predicted AAA+ superfamily ATPase|nr:ATP-binding protein [Prevotellaceae bacterium]
MPYKSRLIEEELSRKLYASGALLIRGPKSCGKTETAKQFARSVLQVDRDAQVPVAMSINPQVLLDGDTPRLIDEWQEQPILWNYVRHEVDDRQKKGQFILTGSANPNEDVKLHSGAGRFTTLNMRTMSWQEMDCSTGTVSVEQLLKGATIPFSNIALPLETIIERIVKGGWAALLEVPLKEAMLLNRAYVDLLAEVDMSRVSNIKRDPLKVRALLKSLARNTATLVDNTTLAVDIKAHENSDLSRPTIIDYLDTLERLMITDDQPAFNPHIRSSASLRKSAKRHFCDVSLAVAALRLDKKALLNDLKYSGFLFESMVTHDLKIYAQANDAEVSHYRDSSGLEIDAIVKQYNGAWAAFEIKLGIGMIDEAAENLNKFVKNLDLTKTPPPASLNIITGTGMNFTRQDGINVISISSLGK